MILPHRFYNGHASDANFSTETYSEHLPVFFNKLNRTKGQTDRKWSCYLLTGPLSVIRAFVDVVKDSVIPANPNSVELVFLLSQGCHSNCF